MYDTNIVYLPNIERNELNTSYSNLWSILHW